MAKKEQNVTEKYLEAVDKAMKPRTEISVIDSTHLGAINTGLSRMYSGDYDGPEMVTCLDLRDRDQLKTAMNAIVGESTSINDLGEGSLHLTAWAARREWSKIGQQTEAQWNVRTVLWDDKGRAFFSFAESILSAIGMFAPFMGVGPFDPPQEISIKKSDIGGGRSWFVLELV